MGVPQIIQVMDDHFPMKSQGLGIHDLGKPLYSQKYRRWERSTEVMW